MKNIQFRGLSDDLYYKLVELKGRLKARTWNEFLAKVVERLEER